jgi:manganese efflux pump family protein
VGWFELVLVALGLSMDAFAVSLGKGMGMHRLNLQKSLIIALLFGSFQAVMPLLGWLMGKQFERYITAVDHWIAFGLLGFIGVKMIFDAWKTDQRQQSCGNALQLQELLILAVATSIDALAVGITFSILYISIVPAVALIGVVTFILSFAGVCLGCRFGTKMKSKAESIGGIVLILIGTKILLEHLGILR